jgi:hypothetical protein
LFGQFDSPHAINWQGAAGAGYIIQRSTFVVSCGFLKEFIQGNPFNQVNHGLGGNIYLQGSFNKL